MGSPARGEEGKMKLPQRATRGLRMTRLLEDDVAADDDFWGQDAFKEEEEDVEFEEKHEKPQEDVFDSDFDDDEPEEAEEGEDESERKGKKRKVYGYGKGKKAPPAAKKKQAPRPKKAVQEPAQRPEGAGAEGEEGRKGAGDRDREGGGARGAEEEGEGEEEGEEGEEGVEEEEEGGSGKKRPKSKGGGGGGGGVVSPWGDEDFFRRKSSRTAVVEKAIEREAILAHKARTGVKVLRKKKEEERKMSQEDMLLEAAQTEIYNLSRLEVMLAREEEVKRKAMTEKALYGGPQIKFRSKDGHNTLEFTLTSELPPILRSKAPPYPAIPICAVTGLPAKYKDPLTGLPYLNAEALRAIRSRYRPKGKIGRYKLQP